MTSLPQDAQSAKSRPDGAIVFQFGMRALLLGMGLLCAMFAIMAVVGVVRSLIMLWFLALIAAHVTANAWGSRFGRRRAHVTEPDSPPTGQSLGVRLSDRMLREPMGPRRLGQVTSVSVSVLICSALGGLAAGVVATVLLASAELGDVSYAGIAVGGVSAAAVGAFVGFLSSGFIHMAARAWREATACE